MSSSVTTIAALQKRVGEMLPSLSKAEAQVLGLLTYGILMLGEWGISGLSQGLAKIEQVPAERQRQRLREFYCRLRSQARQEAARSGCRVTLTRFWGVGEEKYATIQEGGFDEQTAADLHQRIQA